MRLFSSSLLLLSLAVAVPAFSQQDQVSVKAVAMPTDSSNPSVDYAALRETVSRQNKILTDEVNVQRNIVKKNQELLKEAQRLDASNKKLDAEKKKLQAQNADLEKQREALKASQKPAESTSVAQNSPAQ